MSSRCD
jgi:hypothetical protein